MTIAEPILCAAGRAVAEPLIRKAITRRDREGAFRLIYQAYLRAGLSKPNLRQMRITPYQLLPTSEIYLALHGDEPISTVSLIGDGELGLPMESVYGEEVDRLRRCGLRLGEVSCLADRRRDVRRVLPILVDMSRLLVHSARFAGLDGLLVAVHPRHARFYQRYMAYEPLAGQRAYPSVAGHPAVALYLNFARVDALRPRNYEHFFASSFPAEILRPCPTTPSDREYFRLMADQTTLLCMPPEAEEEHVKNGPSMLPFGTPVLAADRAYACSPAC